MDTLLNEKKEERRRSLSGVFQTLKTTAHQHSSTSTTPAITFCVTSTSSGLPLEQCGNTNIDSSRSFNQQCQSQELWSTNCKQSVTTSSLISGHQGTYSHHLSSSGSNKGQLYLILNAAFALMGQFQNGLISQWRKKEKKVLNVQFLDCLYQRVW